MVNYVSFVVGEGEGGGGQTMTEHGQPCFLVKTNYEITQSDLNKPFSFNVVKHILRWKTKHWIHVRWQIHPVKLSYIVNTSGMLSKLLQKCREENSEQKL